jgi:peptidoglycan/LPS O-acetylase OafA/YrhL
MTQRAASGPVGHLPRLDGLRGVAIGLVMLHHFTLYGGMRPTVGLDRLYYAVGQSAWCGVDLFFVLSGFLITGILIDAKGGSDYFRSFYARRALRIFPLYYGTLAAVFWVAPLLSAASVSFEQEIRAQGWYWTYLVNVRTAHYGWPAFLGLGHFWSLAVEEQFYLFWPAIVLLCSRRALPWLCFGLMAGCLLLRAGLAVTDKHVAAYVLMPARMDALSAGALLAVAAREPLWWHGVRRWARRAGVAAAGCLVVLFLTDGSLDAERTTVQTIGFTLTAMVSAGLLVLAIDSDQQTLVARTLASRTLRSLGRYSYGLYVFHHLLVFVLADKLQIVQGSPRLGGSQLPGQMLFLVVATTASMVMALLSWYCWEEPFLRLKRLFPYRCAAATGTSLDSQPGTERAA